MDNKHESYVSLETAKLLKEKGFDWEIKDRWDYCVPTNNWKIIHWPKEPRNWNINAFKFVVSAPTLAVVQRWLREVHNLSIEVYRTACGYISAIVAIPSGTNIKFLEEDGDDLPSGQYTKWEYACEAAIKYCLEHIIYLEKI